MTIQITAICWSEEVYLCLLDNFGIIFLVSFLIHYRACMYVYMCIWLLLYDALFVISNLYNPKFMLGDFSLQGCDFHA